MEGCLLTDGLFDERGDDGRRNFIFNDHAAIVTSKTTGTLEISSSYYRSAFVMEVLS